MPAPTSGRAVPASDLPGSGPPTPPSDPERLDALVRALRSVRTDERERAREELVAMGEAAVGRLVRALREGDGATRRQVGEVIAGIGGPAVDLLLEEAAAPDPSVRVWTLWTLGRIGSPAAEAALAAALEDPSPQVRHQAARSLGEREPLPTAPLVGALRNSDPVVRRLAAEALTGKPCPEAAPALCAALRDPEPAVRVHAAAALRESATPECLPALEAAAGDALPAVRSAAVAALGRLPGQARALRLLVRCLEGSDRRLQVIAMEAILPHGSDAVPPLCRLVAEGMYGDPVAEQALVRIGPRAVPGLLSLLNQRPAAVRRAAARMLVEIAESSPSPQIREALPRLRSLGPPWLLDNPADRSFFRAAADRIDALTEALTSLPTPAGPPAGDGDSLPRPAEAPIADPARLPRPAEAPR